MKKKSIVIFIVLILMIGQMVCFMPNVHAKESSEGMPGARSATNDAGDVFLGGNYIEVGISKGGSFGTSKAAPESFNSHATEKTSYQVGLIADGDGWDVGNAPTAGDFFLPGSPEERFGIAYKIDGVTYQHFEADRCGERIGHDSSEYTAEDLEVAIKRIESEIELVKEWLDTHTEEDSEYEDYSSYYSFLPEQLETYSKKLEELKNAEPTETSFIEFTTRDASDIKNNKLKAIVTGTTPENVKIEITYSFGVNDKYYTTNVAVTNLGDKPITDVRFLRSFDPDQDADLHNMYSTYNKVICNPVSTEVGSKENFAMVVARGGETLNGFFFISFDRRARVSRGVGFNIQDIYKDGLWVETTDGFPTKASIDNFTITKEDKNGYSFEDLAISITTKLGTLNKNDRATTVFYSSLDPNVTESIDTILNEADTTVNEDVSYDDTPVERPSDTPSQGNAKKYNVTFNTNGGSDVSNQTVEKDSKANKPKNPTKNGYTFVNWYTDKELKTSFDFDTQITSDITLYAKWDFNVVVKPEDDTSLSEEATQEVSKIIKDIVDGKEVKGVSKELANKIAKGIANGDEITIEVEKTKVDESDIKDDIEKIKEKIGNDSIMAGCYDIDVNVLLNKVKTGTISELNNKITIVLDKPTGLPESSKGYKRIFKITSLHDGQVIEYETTENGDTLSCEADLFSIFTVSYEDIKESNNPKTGDNIAIWISLMVVSMFGIGIVGKKKVNSK